MLKKDITFIYLDEVQKQVFELIASEAKERGYKTTITNNRFAKCEIGWYCEHINFPQYSKFSVIMLHDIIQQYGNWPDIWLREPWNKYDIGFLPSKIWAENWGKCSQFYYANPRKGVFLTGWPKADRLRSFINNEKKEELKATCGIDTSKPTVLYAPAWENDGKQKDFVEAMKPLDVNILVKQAPVTLENYPEMYKCIQEMKALYKDDKRVIQLDPKTNILDAIMISDILVSEESSTMCECVMMGKPAISVSDWLIPDTTPSRYPADNYDYVIKTKRTDLRKCVYEVLSNYTYHSKEASDYAAAHFENIGKCIPLMLDILDSYVEERDCPIEPLVPKEKKVVPVKKFIYHNARKAKQEFYWNYTQRSKIALLIWSLAKKIKMTIPKP